MWVKAACFAIIGAGIFSAGPTFAWSEPGHRMIGILAYGHLTPAAKAAVDLIISKDPVAGETVCPIRSLEDAAEFPDCVKIPNNHLVGKYQFMRHWHFDNLSNCGQPSPPSVYCAGGNCATEAVKHAVALLGTPGKTDGDRLLALAQVAHFVGDIHQPLHMGDLGDQGGNTIPVSYLGHTGQGYELHAVWDKYLVESTLGSKAQGVTSIGPQLTPGPTPAVNVQNVDAWAAESYALAKDHAYGDANYVPMCRTAAMITIDQAYVTRQAPIIRKQSGLAALRLAGILNGIFR
jgi:hypothetical protein